MNRHLMLLLVFSTLLVPEAICCRTAPGDELAENCRNYGVGCSSSFELALGTPASLPAPAAEKTWQLPPELFPMALADHIHMVNGQLVLLDEREVIFWDLQSLSLSRHPLPQGYTPLELTYLKAKNIYLLSAFAHNDSGAYQQRLFWLDEGGIRGEYDLTAAHAQGLYLRQILHVSDDILLHFWRRYAYDEGQSNFHRAWLDPDNAELHWEPQPIWQKKTHGAQSYKPQHWVVESSRGFMLIPEWDDSGVLFDTAGNVEKLFPSSGNQLVTGQYPLEQGYATTAETKGSSTQISLLDPKTLHASPLFFVENARSLAVFNQKLYTLSISSSTLKVERRTLHPFLF